MYISDDHIFYGSLTLAFLAFLTIFVTVNDIQSTKPLRGQNAQAVTRLQASESPSKNIRFRSSLNQNNSKAQETIAIAILKAGFACPYISQIRPMALSGIFQATCLEQSGDKKEVSYIYNVRSGFVHPL